MYESRRRLTTILFILAIVFIIFLMGALVVYVLIPSLTVQPQRTYVPPPTYTTPKPVKPSPVTPTPLKPSTPHPVKPTPTPVKPSTQTTPRPLILPRGTPPPNATRFYLGQLIVKWGDHDYFYFHGIQFTQDGDYLVIGHLYLRTDYGGMDDLYVRIERGSTFTIVTIPFKVVDYGDGWIDISCPFYGGTGKIPVHIFKIILEALEEAK